MIEKTAKVWLGGRKGVTAPIHLSQYDTGWRFLFSVYDGDAVYTASDATTVYLEGKKADGTVFAVPGKFSDGVAVVECTASITAAVGVIDCELRISEDGETVGTANFEMLVEAAPLQGYVASGDDFSAMQQILDEVEDVGRLLAIAYGAPRAAATAADMTNHDYVYVYTGTTTASLINGHWYFWNGFAWTDGGVYNSTTFATDKTLTVSNAAADAKVTGNKINALGQSLSHDISVISSTISNTRDALETELEETEGRLETKKVNLPLDINNRPTYGTPGQSLRTKGGGLTEWADVGLPTDAQTEQAVNTWLDAHPEATTTVQDHSVTYQKLVNGTLDYVFPEMFGAVGDGEADDTEPVQNAVFSGKPVLFNKIYRIFAPLENVGVMLGTGTIKAEGLEYVLDGTDVDISGVTFDGTDTSYTLLKKHTISGVKLKDITITGFKSNYIGTGFPTSAAVYLNADNVLVDGISVIDNGGHGCQIVSVSGGTVFVSNSLFANNGTGTIDGGDLDGQTKDGGGLVNYGTAPDDCSCLISACEAYGNGASGFGMRSSVIISGCYSHDNGEHGFVLMDGCGGTIVNCKSARNASFAICVQGDFSVEGSSYSDFKIQGCTGYNEHFLRMIYNVSNGLVEGNKLTVDTGTNKYFARFFRYDGSKAAEEETELSITNIEFRGNKYNTAEGGENRMFWTSEGSPVPGVTFDGNTANEKSWNAITFAFNPTLDYDIEVRCLQPAATYDISGNILDYPNDFSKWRIIAGATVTDKNTLSLTTVPAEYTAAGYVYQIVRYSGEKCLSVSISSDSPNTTIALRVRGSNRGLLPTTSSWVRGHKYSGKGIFVFNMANVASRLGVSLGDVCYLDIVVAAFGTGEGDTGIVNVSGVYAKYSDSGIGYGSDALNRAVGTVRDDPEEAERLNWVDVIFGIPANTISATQQSPDDLDNYLSAGSHKCMSTSVASYISNCPVNGPFRLDVIKGTNDRAALQVVRQTNTTDVKVYLRSYYDGAFGTWKLMTAS